MHPILSKLLPSSLTTTTYSTESTPYEPIENVPSDFTSPRPKQKRKRLPGDLNLIYRLLRLKMPTVVLSSLLSLALLQLIHCEPIMQKPTYIEESNVNPYSHSAASVAAASEVRPQYIATRLKNRTSIRRSPQWASLDNMQYSFDTNHAVLVNVGQPSAVVENLTAAESIRKEKRQIVIQQPEPETVQQQTEDSRHYQCDSIIRDLNFLIESPHYPATYPVNRICTYYIARNRADVCQIELNIVDMDIEDTAQCTADYLDLGGGQQERLCGLMLRNTKRLITFPSNGSYIRVTFHSDGQNARPYRGFSAEIHQLPNSCFYPYHGVANGTGQGQQVIYGQRLYPTTRPPQVWIGGPPGYPGARPAGQQPTYIPGAVPVVPVNPTGQLYPPYMVNTSWGQQPQQPLPVQTPLQPLYPPTVVVSGRTNATTGPIYLASYCDVYLGEVTGELRSPGYPFGYPTNHSCIYSVKKAFDDVCQLELIFHHFDIQTPDAKKDLTDNCHGDYLELPDHSKLCGYYNQAMSRDHILKKFYLFPESSDYLFLQFVSDTHQTPDGSGFWIEAKQLRNTCVPGGALQPGRTDEQARPQKCDRVLSGQYTTTDRIYSPNYPNYYSPRQQCVYFIRPADASVCEFELDLVNFQIEDQKPTNSIQELNSCNKDFLQLPDRTRICGRTNFRRIFSFPKYHDRTAMFYFSSDEQIEDRGYEIVVRQLANTCPNNGSNILGGFPGGYPPGNNNQNVYVASDPNLRYNPTPVFTYHNATGFQPYSPSGYPTNYPQQPTVITQVVPSGKSTFGSKKTPQSSIGPSYSIVPNVVNDPRNVDSSGTIPLYYANGSLATRIPPLKPVDMITFLKKGGKTFVHKSGSSIPGGSYAGFDAKSSFIGSPQFGKLNAFNQPRSSPAGFQPRGLAGSGTSAFDLPLQPQLQPTYNCDQVVSRPIEYIRSPNFPSNYPPVTRCIYTILKSDNTVCQVRLHLLTMDLEYTTGCKNDYFQIETTGEKLCGRLSQPETRTINFFGHSRDVRLIFNSDRQLTAPGFEVRVEQIPNSCDDTRSNLTLSSVASISSRSDSSFNQADSRSARMMLNPTVTASPMAAALSFSNRSLQDSPTTPIGGARICRTSALIESIFETDNFPSAYPINTDCLYKVFRANRNICRLEIELQAFDVGNEIFDSAANSNSLPMSPVATTCPNDFLEIDQVKYCGRRSGQTIAVNFPRFAQEVSFRFLSVSPDPFNGFRIRVKQISENCRASSTNFLSDSSDGMAEFSPATIESCPKLVTDPSNGDSSAGAAGISEQIIRIQSPKFGLSSTVGYEPFLDCDYVIQKYSRDVCALEIKFESFNVEESRACSKDYLEINGNVNSRICGKMPVDTIRNFEFVSNSMRLRFHTDADRNDTGFAMVLRQIRC